MNDTADATSRIAELKQELDDLYKQAEEEGDCFWCDGCGNGEAWRNSIMKELAELGDPEGLAHVEVE